MWRTLKNSIIAVLAQKDSCHVDEARIFFQSFSYPRFHRNLPKKPVSTCVPCWWLTAVWRTITSIYINLPPPFVPGLLNLHICTSNVKSGMILTCSCGRKQDCLSSRLKDVSSWVQASRKHPGWNLKSYRKPLLLSAAFSLSCLLVNPSFPLPPFQCLACTSGKILLDKMTKCRS